MSQAGALMGRAIGRLSLLSGVAVVALAISIASGVLDRLAPDGSIDKRRAIACLVLFAAALGTAVWIVPALLRNRRYAFFMVVVTAVALGVVELAARRFIPGADVVRMVSGGLPSAELHHMLPPNTRMYVGRFEGKQVFLDTNEDGLRTPYSRAEFLAHQERVIVLGDSFAFGLGVSSDETFATRLETALRGSGRPSTAVLNAGIVSYSPFLSRLLLERRLAAYRPTLVLLLLDATDIGDDYRYRSEAIGPDGAWTFPFASGTPTTYRGAIVEMAKPLLRRLGVVASYPIDVMADLSSPDGSARHQGPYDYYEFSVMVGETREENRYFIFRHPLDNTRHFFDQTLGNVDAIAELSTRLGARFALIVTPRFHHWNNREAPENWEKYKYDVDEPHEFEYFRYFNEADRPYPILNLLSDFQRTDRFPLVFRQDPHWNAAGHAFAAEVVHARLAASKFLSAPGPITRAP